jgi:drug/metabolite transporter (DMT)-like permease
MVLIRYAMEIQQNKTISKRYWFTWGLSSAIGLWLLLNSLGGPHLCSPVIGCGVEAPMMIAIIISAILLVIRAFKKNKAKLITPLILLVLLTPSLLFYLVNTV